MHRLDHKHLNRAMLHGKPAMTELYIVYIGISGENVHVRMHAAYFKTDLGVPLHFHTNYNATYFKPYLWQLKLHVLDQNN